MQNRKSLFIRSFADRDREIDLNNQFQENYIFYKTHVVSIACLLFGLFFWPFIKILCVKVVSVLIFN